MHVPQLMQANPTSSQKGASKSSFITLSFNLSVGTLPLILSREDDESASAAFRAVSSASLPPWILSIKSSRDKIRVSVPTDKLNDKGINELFEAPFWEDVAFACINCGTCTYLCPTCWCVDIQDEVFGKDGDRIRNWDSCMFPLFTLHGSGHNPRDKKVQRVRQRFMHKLKYYVNKYHNGVQCSGCGRCVRYCPVNIDIREVAKIMNGYT